MTKRNTELDPTGNRRRERTQKRWKYVITSNDYVLDSLKCVRLTRGALRYDKDATELYKLISTDNFGQKYISETLPDVRVQVQLSV